MMLMRDRRDDDDDETEEEEEEEATSPPAEEALNDATSATINIPPRNHERGPTLSRTKISSPDHPALEGFPSEAQR